MKKYIKICLLVSFVLILPTKKVFAMDTEDSVQNDRRFPSFYYKQNKNFTREEVASLITNGRNIISALLQKEKPEEIFKRQTLTIFSDPNRSKFYNLIDFTKGNLAGEWDTDAVSRTRQTHLEAVIAVSWAIAFTPWVKGEEITRGSFSIKDDDEALNTFLEFYAIEASGLKSKDIKDLTFLSGTNFAYGRATSHYTRQTINQTGIDARFSKGGYSLTVLPFENTHILFGRVHTRGGEDKTFFKLESAGLGDASSVASHSMSYLAQEPENPELFRREKDLLFHIKQNFETCLNDLGCDEKTRQIIHAYEELKKNPQLPKEGETTYLGINEMVHAIQHLSQAKKQQEQKLEEFLKTLTSYGYSTDNLNYRTGNEFVISLQDIVNPPRNPVVDKKDEEKARQRENHRKLFTKKESPF